MTREEVELLAETEIVNSKYLILELITGMGKTKIALDLVKHLQANSSLRLNVLILVSKTVAKSTWKNEIDKWGGLSCNYDIICYESLHKYEESIYDIVIADEMQHLSENRLDSLSTLVFKKFIGLSATISRDTKSYFINTLGAYIITCGLQSAVASNTVPEPMLYLLPLRLDNGEHSFIIKKKGINRYYTQAGYYKDKSYLIDFYKRKYFSSHSESIKNLWLSSAGKRLKWLATQKESIILQILSKLNNKRTITFCGSINQAEVLGKYNITSKNKMSSEYLSLFNDKKIGHITACNILNESVNLVECKVGIFCSLNSSEIITKQRIGRLLRDKHPVIIIPYYRDTREEELVNEMIKDYNKSHIKFLDNIDNLKL